MDRNNSALSGLIKIFFYFRRPLFLAILLLTITLIVSVAQSEAWKEDETLSASHASIQKQSLQVSAYLTEKLMRESKTPSRVASSLTSTVTPTPSILGPDYDPTLDLHAGPVSLPIKILIPILDVDAPILGVGLTTDNNMDAPKGLYGDPNWSSAFWYRGSAIPGEPGTATMAGHVNGLLGEPETFARIRKLKPGDLIIIKVNNTNTAFYFVVDEVKRYSMAELKEPELLKRIFGANVGSDEQKLDDGKSHLTLITCIGNYIAGEFDHRIVVFSTLR